MVPGGEPSAAFGLVAACCRWPIDPAAIRAAAAGSTDWTLVVRLARRHRVIGLVRVGLVAAGIAPPPGLDALYRQVIQRNLLHYGEAVRITGRLADAGIRVLLLKGVVVAQLAYGDQRTKQTVDNDLLIDPRDVPAAIAVLDRLGYRIVSPPGIDGARVGSMIQAANEAQLVSPATGAIADLHWRLHPYRHALDEPDVAKDAQMVTVDGKPLPALVGDAALLYLAVHGARHSWARLKWLADFNALVGRLDDREVAALRASARREGVGPCLDSALMLCHRLFGAAIPRDVRRARRARLLARLAEYMMAGPEQEVAQGRYARAWLASTIVTTTRARSLAPALWHLWVTPADVLAMPLPRPLRPLYLAISPVRRVGRLIARGFARARSGPMRPAQEK